MQLKFWKVFYRFYLLFANLQMDAYDFPIRNSLQKPQTITFRSECFTLCLKPHTRAAAHAKKLYIVKLFEITTKPIRYAP